MVDWNCVNLPQTREADFLEIPCEKPQDLPIYLKCVFVNDTNFLRAKFFARSCRLGWNYDLTVTHGESLERRQVITYGKGPWLVPEKFPYTPLNFLLTRILVFGWLRRVKPGSHERCKHKGKIKTKTKHAQGLAKIKQQEFSFVSSFVRLLGLMLGLWSYAYDYDGPYVAGLTSFLCFAFCFALILTLTCEPG